MYQILVVDDSVLDVDCITFLINKYELPLEVATAVNGQEALGLFQNPENHFDILFTDIRMPFLDGLGLSKEVRKLSPNTRIVIFSGFNDFEYAKTAITIGVEDYLMKPVIPDEFVSVMTRVINGVEETNRQIQTRRSETRLLKNHMLWLAVNGKNGTPADSSSFFKDRYTGLMLIECSNEFFSLEGISFQEKLEGILTVPFDYLNLDPARSILFFKEEAFLFPCAQAVCLCAEKEFNQKCCVAFQDLPDNSSISQIYTQLEKRLENHFFFPEQNIFLPDGPDHPYAASGHISIDIVSDDLRLKDYDSLMHHLEDLFESLKHEKTHSLIFVKYCFTELMKEIIHYLPDDQKPDLNKVAEKIYSSANIVELIDMTCSQAKKLLSQTQKNQGSCLKSDKIRQYIYQNYTQPLSLNDISSHFYISPNYLCSVFKKETGCNLMKFINEYRLEQAAKLLLETEMKVNKIAETVGFSNPSYFSQRFRDYYGESPENYRQKETY
ncbi:MAG: helix-turn-helix domain-containing protein [Clostridiales bacterium]|nr:helix-turn-helix domain-containing protein [Clostridiales bacterium]